jgi:hypothetical protein
MAMATLAVVRPAWSRVAVAVTQPDDGRPMVNRVDGHANCGPSLAGDNDREH